MFAAMLRCCSDRMCQSSPHYGTVTKMAMSDASPGRGSIQDLSGVGILIVDDQANMRTLVRGTLVAHGCQNVLQTGDAREALRLFSSHTIDLVICDWVMEPMSGLEFVRALRRPERGNDVPVIMLTGNSDPRDIVLAQPFRIGGWLIKPIAAKQLMERISAVLKVPDRTMDLEPGLNDELEDMAIRYRAKLTEDLDDIEKMLTLLHERTKLPEAPVDIIEIVDGRRVLTRQGTGSTGDLVRSWRTTERIMHDIKGQAGSFGFDLITLIAERGQSLMRTINGDLHIVHQNGINLHKFLMTLVQSMRLVLQKELRGDGGIVGARLMEKLDAYTVQVRTGLNMQARPDAATPFQRQIV
jgi:two-component system, chemotaxis family, chemotaxis protein CheY